VIENANEKDARPMRRMRMMGGRSGDMSGGMAELVEAMMVFPFHCWLLQLLLLVLPILPFFPLIIFCNYILPFEIPAISRI